MRLFQLFYTNINQGDSSPFLRCSTSVATEGFHRWDFNPQERKTGIAAISLPPRFEGDIPR
jgi:hypothetical protein